MTISFATKFCVIITVSRMMKKNKTGIIVSTDTWALFLTVQTELVSRMEAELKKSKLPPLTWYDVLWALECSPDHRLRMHELANKVVLSRSNLTRLVDRLERSGLVKREQSIDDKRGAHCVLKTSGLTLRKKMWPVYQKCIFALFNRHLSEKSDAKLKSVLKDVLTAIRTGENT